LLTNVIFQYSSEQADWTHFQNDLLTAVRVANDFRLECELKTKSIMEENQVLKRRTDDLTAELEKIKPRKASVAPLTKIILPITGETEAARSRLDTLPLRSLSEREAASRTSRTSTTPHQVT
jgi:hypothetical protein